MFKKIIFGLFTCVVSVNLFTSEQQGTQNNNGQQAVSLPLWDSERNKDKESDLKTMLGGTNPNWDGNTQFSAGLSVAELIEAKKRASIAATAVAVVGIGSETGAAAAALSSQAKTENNNEVSDDSKK